MVYSDANDTLVNLFRGKVMVNDFLIRFMQPIVDSVRFKWWFNGVSERLTI
jgi:hypothetical protein